MASWIYGTLLLQLRHFLLVFEGQKLAFSQGHGVGDNLQGSLGSSPALVGFFFYLKVESAFREGTYIFSN